MKKLYSSDVFNKSSLFRIIYISNYLNESLYSIKEIIKNENLDLNHNSELILNTSKNKSNIWKFIRIINNTYRIKNNNSDCYINKIGSKYYCSKIPVTNAIKFNIERIFLEVEEIENNTNKEILEKEPIDIIIKYIDLKDPELNRTNIHQIEKDIDNEELRYSVRSILKYIPWCNKIYILMPNKKVRYFKKYNFIKEKIIYLNDKDFLGFDSSNTKAFFFRYWRLKKFGISDNIISMDDDYFIGQKLEKSDFFYVENGKVLPLITTSNFIKINKETVLRNCEYYKKIIKKTKKEQTSEIFEYSRYLTYLFILQIFNITNKNNIFIPNFTHNAIPINLKDIKELYDLIVKSKYKYLTLESSYRIEGGLQFQTLTTTYTFLKNSRKIKDISYKYIGFDSTLFSSFNSALFCINKGAKKYSFISSLEEKIVMEDLFPNPTKYERKNYKIAKISKILARELNIRNKKLIKDIDDKTSHFYEIYFIHIIFIFVIFIKNNYRIYKD